jgi:hypothetical protein
MPLVRYFLWVGSVLLALLFIADASLPNLPAGKTTTDRPSPAIRIHSERKWPERIVFDTSAPMPRVATDASSVQGNPVQQTAAVIPDRAREALLSQLGCANEPSAPVLTASELKIMSPSGPKRRLRDVCYSAAVGGYADV